MKWVFRCAFYGLSALSFYTVQAQTGIPSAEGISVLQQYVTDLEKEIQGLRDRVERLEHWKSLKDSSMSQAQETPASPLSPPLVPSSPKMLAQNEDPVERDYNAALILLQNHQMEDAKLAFESFQQQHPQSPLSVKARYWIGVIYVSQKNFGAARDVFEMLMRTHPNGPKKYDILLRIAQCAKAQSQPGAACQALNTLFSSLGGDSQRSQFDRVEKQARLLSQELACSPERTPN